MRTSKNLFDLIRSLSKGEKRHFKLTVQNKRKGVSNYILLFDALDKQATFNEKKLLKKLQVYSFSKSLSKTTYLLYDLLLKNQLQLKFGQNTESKICTLINSADFLYHKNLYQQANYLLIKAKKLAINDEQYFWHLKIIKKEQELVPYLAKSKTNKIIQKLVKEKEEIIQYLIKEESYKDLFQQITIDQSDPSNSNKEEFSIHPLLRTCDTNISFLSKVYFLLCHHTIALAKQKMNIAFKYVDKLIDLWDSNPNKKELLKEEYIFSCTKYIFCALNFHHYEIDFHEILNNINKLSSNSEQEEKKKKTLVTTLDFMVNVALNNIEIAKTQLFTIEEMIENNQLDLLENVWSMRLYYYVSVYHFIQGEHQESLHWSSSINEYSNDIFIPHIQTYCKLMNLMSRYELKHFQLLEYEIGKTYRFLKKQKCITQIEMEVLSCVKFLIRTRYAIPKENTFSELSASLHKMNEIQEMISYQSPSLFYNWIQNKIPNTSLN